MEFGKVELINNIEWLTPSDDPLTISFLPQLRTTISKAKVYIGAPAWSHKEWIGKVYPSKTKAADFLFHYSRAFNCIELNTTHYRIPTESQVKNWVEQTPSEFQFCPKVPQNISHSLTGLANIALLNEWWKSLSHFKEKLGPSFIQFPPSFTYAQKIPLFHFLKNWPTEIPLCLEFRHGSWFDNNKVLPALTEFLRTRAIGLVITDVAGRQDVLHTSVSSDYTFVRFVGNNLHTTDFFRAELWAKRLKYWQELGLRKIYFIVHQPDDLCAPDMAEFIIKKFNDVCDSELSPMPWFS